MQVIGLGSEAKHLLCPTVSSFLSVSIAWGLGASLAVWSCYGVSGLICTIVKVLLLEPLRRHKNVLEGQGRHCNKDCHLFDIFQS